MVYLTRQEQALFTLANEIRVQSAGLLVTNIGQAAQSILDDLFKVAIGLKLDELKPQVRAYLGRNLGLAISLSAADISKIDEQVENVLNNDYTSIVDLTKLGIGLHAGGLFASFYELLNGVNALTSSYVGMIQRIGIDPYVQRFVNTTVRPNIPAAEIAWYMHNIGAISDDEYEAYMAQNGWSDDLRTKLEMAWIRPVPIDMILDLRRRNLIDVEMSKSMLKQHGYVGVMNSWIDSLAVQVPEPYRTADFAAKGLLTDDVLEESFKYYGLGGGWRIPWKMSQHVFPQFGIALELLWRGVIDAGTFVVWQERNAIPVEVGEKMLALAEQIPPAGDLVTMVVREAFEPKYVVPAPEPFAVNMAKKGFTKDWSDRYWTAHFLPMPIMQAYDNLRRGYWTKEQFLELLRIADIHPAWREDIYNVAFNPPSIREMGYGYDVGVYSIEDIVRFRRWGGLSETDAVKAGQAMVAYRTEAEREAVRREYLYLYTLDKISKEDYEAALINIGTAAEAVPLWLERGDLQKIRKETETGITEPKTLTRSDAQWLFENGLRDESWLRAVLDNLGYSDSSIDAYVDQSKKRIADRLAEEAEVTPRKLTLAMIQNLIKLELLDKDEATAEVVKLGYTKEDAALVIQIMLARVYAEPEERVLTDAHITTLYDYNLVSESDILAHFKARGYSDVDARLLTQLAVITKNLPDLKDMYSKGWINQKQLFEGVKALGIPMEAVEPSEYPKLSKLIEVIGLPEEKANRIMLTIVKAEQPARTAAEKDLTKAEIVKGVKVGVIAPVEGVSLLQGLGYDENEAWYILAINKVVSAGDPEGYWEMRRVVEAAKKARGQSSVDIPEELVSLERERRDLIANIDQLKAQKATEEELGTAAVYLANIESRMHTIIAKLKLA